MRWFTHLPTTLYVLLSFVGLCGLERRLCLLWKGLIGFSRQSHARHLSLNTTSTTRPQHPTTRRVTQNKPDKGRTWTSDLSTRQRAASDLHIVRTCCCGCPSRFSGARFKLGLLLLSQVANGLCDRRDDICSFSSLRSLRGYGRHTVGRRRFCSISPVVLPWCSRSHHDVGRIR